LRAETRPVLHRHIPDGDRPPNFRIFHSLLQVFREAAGVVIPPAAAGPEVENTVVGAAAVSDVAEPEVASAALVSAAGAAGHQASADIALVFDVSAPVSAAPVEVDSSGRPRFLAFPSADRHASSSSSVEDPGQESVHSSTGVHASHGLCSIFSNLGPHQNRNSEHGHNRPNHGHNSVSDTNGLPMDATTSHSRRICLHLHQEQRIRRSYQGSLSHPEVPQIRWLAAGKFQCLYLPPPLPEQEQLTMQKGLFPKVTFSYCLPYLFLADYDVRDIHVVYMRKLARALKGVLMKIRTTFPFTSSVS
jgi:hypothetical protein